MKRWNECETMRASALLSAGLALCVSLLPGCQRREYTRDDAGFASFVSETWMVADRPEFIFVVRHVVMTVPSTVFGDGKFHVFESGARVYLCDVRTKTAQLLCTISAPSRDLWIKDEQIVGWLGDAFYVRLRIDNQAKREVTEPVYRVHITGGFEPVESPPADLKPLLTWRDKKYLFLETSERLDRSSPLTIRRDEGPNNSTVFSYGLGNAREWHAVFSVANGSVEVEAL